MKTVIKATGLCFQEKTVFTMEVTWLLSIHLKSDHLYMYLVSPASPPGADHRPPAADGTEGHPSTSHEDGHPVGGALS